MVSDRTMLTTMSRWVRLYNNDVDRMIDELYADEFVARLPGILTVENDKPLLHGIEAAVLEIAPDRRVRAERVIGLGEDAVLEATLGGVDLLSGEPWLTHFCAVLTFSGGRIVRDDTYIDLTRWPAGAALVARFTAGTTPVPAAEAGR